MTMTRRYVEIRYTDAVERVPLPDLDELPRILEERGSYVGYEIHSSWRYGLVPHGKGSTVEETEVAPRADEDF
jgi:hypothetical protein